MSSLEDEQCELARRKDELALEVDNLRGLLSLMRKQKDTNDASTARYIERLREKLGSLGQELRSAGKDLREAQSERTNAQTTLNNRLGELARLQKERSGGTGFDERLGVLYARLEGVNSRRETAQDELGGSTENWEERLPLFGQQRESDARDRDNSA